MAEFIFEPTAHKAAADFIKSKPALPRAVFDTLLPDLKGLAFTITGIEQATVLQNVRDRVAELPAGADWDESKKEIINDITPFFVDPEADAEEQAKQRYGAERRAELLLRTHGQQAYAATAYQGMDAQRGLFPYWQYQTLGDGRVRDAHRALDGVVLPADHEFWQTHFPPWDWGCRCQCIPLSQDDYEDVKAADEKRDEDQKLILEGPLLKELEQNRRLVRGPNTIANVQAPSETGDPHAYRFFPENLRPSIDKLKERYDPEVFAAFETWAKKQKISPRKTVWQWLSGPEPKKTREPVAEITKGAASAWPADPAQLTQVRGLGGSTGAMLVRDSKTGEQFVLKRGNSPDHLREEVAADNAYRALGIAVPEVKLYETGKGPVKLARFVQGENLNAFLAKAPAAQKAAVLAKIQEGFAADALLGNWDVAGLNLDNIVVDAAGTPWRIDNGGSFRFRAQGAAKTADEWNAFTTELWTMRDATKSPAAAKLFRTLNIYDISRQVSALNGEVLLATLPDPLRAVVSDRLTNLQAIATKALDMEHDRWKAGYTDDLTRHMMGMRKAGIVARLPKELTQTPGQVLVKDENGVPWDHLRTQGSVAKPVGVPGDTFADPILQAIKTVNHHGATGGTANQTKVDFALAQKASLQKLSQNGTAEQKAMATAYLEKIAQLENSLASMKKGPFQPVAQFTPFKPAAAAPTRNAQSIVADVADYMRTQGTNWSHISAWAAAQAGSSSSGSSTVYSRFLRDQLDLPDKTFHKLPPPDAVRSALGANSDAWIKSMTIHHAFVQELLGNSVFRGNDRTLRRTRIIRTEQKAAVVKFGVGQTGTYPRRVNASGSLFKEIFSGARTITNVPHSRVTSVYLIEQSPGSGTTFLYGDAENEATYIAGELPCYNAGSGSVSHAPGDDATQWEIKP